MKTKTLTLLATMVITASLAGCAPAAPGATFKPPTLTPISVPKLYDNPYRNLANWYRGQTHTHTKSGPEESDGECRLPVTDVAELYNQAGYDFLAITDHNQVGQWSASNMLLINGCESGKKWENHLSAIDVASCPEECASNDWGHYVEGLPRCNNTENQRRICQALRQDGLVFLNHPSSTTGLGVEDGWTKAKMQAVQGYQAIEVVSGSKTSFDEWKFLLDLGRRIWGVGADDFHCAEGIGKGWIVVNSNASPIDEQDILANIKNGNFYFVASNGQTNQLGPAFVRIDVLSGIVNVRFKGARVIRFLDSTGPLKSERVSSQDSENSSYFPDDITSGDLAEGYLRIELEDDAGNTAYSQPLFVKSGLELSTFGCAQEVEPGTGDGCKCCEGREADGSCRGECVSFPRQCK